MLPPLPRSWRRSATLALASAALALPAAAGTIPFDTFLQFSFTDAGVQAQGCLPADPGGLTCVESSGTPTQFLDAPAWTFEVGAGGATLTVIDAFLSTEDFEVFDFGVSLGLTSGLFVDTPFDCGDDPVVCLGVAEMSRGFFALGAGLHSITIVPTRSDGLGAAYLHVAGNAVPAPSTLALLGLGLLAGPALRRRPQPPTAMEAA